MNYITEKWLLDELKLLQTVMGHPSCALDNPDQQIGEYRGTHRAATHILQSIIDALGEVIEEEEAKEDF